jgi:hypothetical protein
MIPGWLHVLSIVAVAFGFACAAAILADEVRHPQPMTVMNAVWPVVALFGMAAALWIYFSYGRTDKDETPKPVVTAKATAHCGAGCTIGDICAEWLVFAFPAIATAFGWHSLFKDKMIATWIIDYLFAFGLGIVFQYFTIAPMRDFSPGAGIVAALKADALSLTAWQVGMYGFMAFAQFVLFDRLLQTRLVVASAEFWFMMQIAMLAGFATSYPVNAWLLRAGVKEAM